MNRIVLLGRLTRDPEMKVVEESGKVVTRFVLAVDRTFKSSTGEKVADFIPVVIWGKKAEVAAEFLTKGSRVTVGGRLQTRNYEDKDGQKRVSFEVVADEFQFVEFRKNDESAI